MNEKKISFLGEKKKIIIFISFALGVILLIAYYAKTGDNEKNARNTHFSQEAEYSTFLEQKLKSTLESVLGEGKCEVMITLEKKQEKQNSAEKSTSELFTFSSEKSENDTSDSSSYDIRGVMIICKDVTNSGDFETIKRAATTALGTTYSKIYIIGGASTQ